MGNDKFFINISRGELVAEEDLLMALKTKQLKGAVLDVVSTEPLSRWSKLWKLPNLLITLHIAGNINIINNIIQKDFILKLKKNYVS